MQDAADMLFKLTEEEPDQKTGTLVDPDCFFSYALRGLALFVCAHFEFSAPFMKVY